MADQSAAFELATVTALAKVAPQVMLTEGIAQAYVKGSDQISGQQACIRHGADL